MIDNNKITAIILVAGNSIRFGTGKNKNFELINNRTILSYSLNAFNSNQYIDDIIIATRKKDIKVVQDIVNLEKLNKDLQIIIGGDTRKESVYNCIRSTYSDIVIIHDGARPAIKQKYINDCIENMKNYKGVTIGVKSKDTIKITDDNDIVLNTTKRSNTWIIQTPQCFNREVLLKVHEKYKDAEVTDDCMLLEKEGYAIKLLSGDYTNIKITTSEDMDMIAHQTFW